MKKSLMIISFAFIFLLTLSVVSANFFDWITGDAQGSNAVEKEGGALPKGISGEGDWECDTDKQCGGGQICSNHKCVRVGGIGTGGEWECDLSSQCGKGEVCIKKKCVSKKSIAGKSSVVCPSEWNTLSAKEGGNCCRKAENRGRGTRKLFSRI